MRRLVMAGVLVGLGVTPVVALGAPLDGSTPMLCAPSSVVECSRKGECQRSTPEDADVPPFVKVDLGQRQLTSLDGARTSPISASQRNDGRLMLQGMQNTRVWGAVIDEQTGQMTATIGEDDGAIVIIGTCVAP